jgi:DNA polymerase III epsilon subunit-like protein
MDSMKFFRKLLCSNNNSLKYLCKLFNIDTKNHHRAYDDVIMLEKLFLKGIEIFKLRYNLNEVDIDMIYKYIYEESF